MAGKRKEKRKEKSRGLLAVWALLSRCSFYKIMLILFVMVLAECVSFYAVLQGSALQASPEAIIDSSFAPVIFLGAMGMILFVLALAEGQMDRKSQYTLMRLSVSRKPLFLIRMSYHILCLAVLFTVQIVLAIWMVEMYEKAFDITQPSGQLLFLTFYRNEFLHCLLPMAETGKWVRNILLFLAFGMEGCVQRKNPAVAQVSMFVMTAVWFISPIGAGYRDVVCDLVYGVAIGVDLFQAKLFQKEGAEMCL